MMKPNKTTSENDTKPLDNDDPMTPAHDESGAGDEFQLTIKKLELPVRPRGVLAD